VGNGRRLQTVKLEEDSLEGSVSDEVVDVVALGSQAGSLVNER